MVYRILSSQCPQASLSTIEVPVTVQQLQDIEIATEPEQSYTVLDLANPVDLQMMKEAGYEVVDLSTRLNSTSSSYASSETQSIDTDMSDLDPDIARAAMQSAESGSLIPILKEELKFKIQKRRLKEGKGLLQVDDNRTSVGDELTADDQERRKRRRERNKVAAQKCRFKRRERADELEKETNNLESHNESLKSEIDKLQAEHELLMNMLRTHDICPRTCNTRLSTCSDDGSSTSSHCPSTVPDELDIQMDIEVEECPESPFSVALIEADHYDVFPC